MDVVLYEASTSQYWYPESNAKQEVTLMVQRSEHWVCTTGVESSFQPHVIKAGSQAVVGGLSRGRQKPAHKSFDNLVSQAQLY